MSRSASNRNHGSVTLESDVDGFVNPVADLVTMIHQRNWVEVERIGEALAQRARLRHLASRSDGAGVVIGGG